MTPELERVVQRMEAERMNPVPRSNHVVGVEADDLALLLAHIDDHTLATRMTADTAAAYGRLDKVIRRAA